MTEIVQGLFGASPQELMAQRQAAMQAQGNAYAAQDPFARASSLLYQGGQGLGNVVGGMLGGKDQEMITASKIAAIVKNGDQTTPEGMMAIAKQFAAEGLSGPASLAQQKAQEMQKAQAQMGLVEAQTKQAESRANKYESDAKRQAFGGLGKVNVNTHTPSSVDDFYASVEEGKPDYSLLVPRDPVKRAEAKTLTGKQASEEGFEPGSPEFIARVKEINAAKGAEKPVSSAVAKELGTIAQKKTVLDESGKKLAELAPQVQGLDLGLVSNWFRQGAAAIGVNTQDRITFDKIKREMLAEANNLLLAAKGTQTEGDAQRARDQIADENTWKNKDALSAAIQGLIDTHQRSVAAFEANAGVLKQAGKPASQINMAPAAAPAPMAAKPAAAAVVDYAAAFARAKQLNPAWNNFTLEQFTAKAKQQGK